MWFGKMALFTINNFHPLILIRKKITSKYPVRILSYQKRIVLWILCVSIEAFSGFKNLQHKNSVNIFKMLLKTSFLRKIVYKHVFKNSRELMSYIVRMLYHIRAQHRKYTAI